MTKEHYSNHLSHKDPSDLRPITSQLNNTARVATYINRHKTTCKVVESYPSPILGNPSTTSNTSMMKYGMTANLNHPIFLFLAAIIVMMISILLFMVVRVDNLALRALSRIVLIPVIAGISYEFLRLAGRSENPIINILSRPGMWMQGLTTTEPTPDMVEVAIKATEAVFDWRAFLAENFGENAAVVQDAEKTSCCEFSK